MFRERVRDTLKTHGKRAWRNRAVWALIVYYYGVWALQRRWRITRWLASKVYAVLSIWSEIVTGVTMYPSMQLPGKGLHIIHPSSVYIHPRSVLGERVGIMHNVTLGTNMRKSGDAPVIGNDVFIGVGACILGKVKIGDGARIAANSLVINSVPPGAFAIGVPAKVMMMPSVKEQELKKKSREGGASEGAKAAEPS